MIIKNIECPICKKKYVSKSAIYNHLEKEHNDEIPDSTPADQYYYDLTHKGIRTKCTICHEITPWNPRTHKYHRLCGKPSCDNEVRRIFRERMLKIHNTDNLTTDPEHQRKMLAGRSIHGVYKWSTGGETDYIGSYEHDFLRTCDTMLELHASDIIGPSPHTFKYTYNNKEHFYIPDFYIPDLNIEIEIKDGGDNPNMHHKIQSVDKVKEQEKDNIMLKQNKYHYIKIVNKNYGNFLALFAKIRDDNLSNEEKRDMIKII